MKINLFLFPVLLISAFFGFFDEYILMFLALLLHEAAHLLAVRTYETEISSLTIEPFGMKITLKDEIVKNPSEEIRIAAAGPLFSLICGGAVFLFSKISHINLYYFSYCNLSLGVFNLLPVFPADGGRILRAYLSLKTGYIKSYNAVRKLTFFISCILILSGIYVILITRFNFSFCLTGAFLYYGMLAEKNHTALYLNRELNRFKTKSSDFDRMDILRIAVNKNYSVRKILGELTLKRYCIAEVFEGNKKICEFTEGELMEAMIEKGSDIKIKDIYK